MNISLSSLKWVIAVIVVSITTVVASPKTVNLNINISDDAGPFEGIKRVEVSLFDENTDTGWSETHKSIVFSSGSAELELGEVNETLYSALIRLSTPNFRLMIDGIESIVTFAPSASPYALDLPSLWDGTLLGNERPEEIATGVIHPDWIIGGVTQPGDGDGDGDGSLDADEVRDIVETMVDNGTQAGITVSSSGDPKVLNFDVDDPTIALIGDVTGVQTMTDLGNVALETTLDMIVPISKGGTGATNQNDALTNLGLTGLSPYTEGASSGIKVDGDFWITGAFYFEGAFTPDSPSDIRFKKNILPIPDASSRLKSVRGVYYNWKTQAFPDKGFSKDRQIGVIAQELEKEFPELVNVGSDGYKRVNYMLLSAILVEALNEQQTKIESLEKRLNALERAIK